MTNKLLLALIALGLWANVASNLVRPAHAQVVESYLSDIAREFRTLVGGTAGCRNKKICD